MRPCKTCNSPYREEIDELIREGWEYKEILRYLKGKYPNAKLPSYDSICNHARNHVKGEIERALKSNQQLQRKIRTEIRATAEAAEQLRENLILLKTMIQRAKEQGVSTPEDRRALTSLISETNQTIRLLLQFSEKVDRSSMSEDDIYDRLMYAISGLDPKIQYEIAKRWDEYSQ